MIRLIFVLILILVVITLIYLATSALSASVDAARTVRREVMPSTFQNIAYAALILLMLGICSGVLGLV